MAAAQSVAQSKAIFARLGGPQPQWKAVLAYVDIRLRPDGAGPAAMRAAEDAVDKAFMWKRPAVWRVPNMASL